jgi:hypothetical protein
MDHLRRKIKIMLDSICGRCQLPKYEFFVYDSPSTPCPMKFLIFAEALEANDLVGALAPGLEHPLDALRVTTVVNGNADTLGAEATCVIAASIPGANLAGSAVSIRVALLV